MCAKIPPKGVHFNSEKAVDFAILQYVKNKNFSGLAKKAILEKMKREGIEIPSKNSTVQKPSNKPSTQLSKLDLLKQQLAQRIDDNSQRNTNT